MHEPARTKLNCRQYRSRVRGSAIGLLRAQNASSVWLWHRMGYVKDTVAMLEQAKELSGGEVYVVNWIAGIVYAQLPGRFHQKEAARRELAWCVENAEKAPHAGWLREVYYQQAKLALADGDPGKAQDLLRRSGYQNAIRRGDERGAIHQANLIPPGLLNGRADVYLPYLILREHVIDRLYDQNVGYWQPDLQGLAHLTRADHVELLVDYLGVSERQLVKTLEHLSADGKYELAASLLESCGDRFEHSPSVANARRVVYLKLMEKHQNTDPFEFILYSGRIREQTPQLALPK